MKAKIIQKVQANRPKKNKNKTKFTSALSHVQVLAATVCTYVKTYLIISAKRAKGLFFFQTFRVLFRSYFDVMLSLGRSHSHELSNVMSWIKEQQDASSLNYIYY